MKSTFVLHLFLMIVLIAAAAVSAAGQEANGYTPELVYDEETDQMIGYAETYVDYVGIADYSADLTLSVIKTGTTTVVASGSMHDPYSGWAYTSINFGPGPDECYTARGFHKMRASMWDYAPSFPYGIEYFDDWYFSIFPSQSIFHPFAYQFASPGYDPRRLISNIIMLGTTYSAKCAPPTPTVVISDFQVVGKGTSLYVYALITPEENIRPIIFKIRKTSGSGSATFGDTSTSKLMSQSGSFEVKGVTESSEKDNFVLEATILTFNGTSTIASRTFSVAKVKISRTIGSGSPTELTVTTNTIVGERVKLAAEIVPSGLSASGHSWTLPGSVMKNWVASTASASVQPVNPLNAANVDFVWYDGGNNSEVVYQGTVNGIPIPGKAIFNVLRPESGVTTISTSGSSTTIDSATGDLEVHYGGTTPQTAGIRFSRSSLTVPSPFSGTTQWVQSLSVTVTTTTTGDVTSTSSATGLDKCYPFTEVEASAWDSPGFRLDGFKHVNLSSQWSMWLMFKPAGDDSSWVPLRKVDWRWLAEAQMTNSVWSLVGHTNPNSPSQPTDADTTIFPVWSNVVGTCNE